MATMTVDAVVVGAGVAGSVAAARLARNGTMTAIVGPHRGLDGAFDVVVPSEVLSDVGAIAVRTIRSYVVRFDESRSTCLAEPKLSACRRGDLDAALLASAIAHGAVHVPGLVVAYERSERGWLVTVAAEGSGTTRLFARHLLWAAGTDGIGHKASNASTWAQNFVGLELGGKAALHLVPPARNDPHSPPISVRAVPSADRRDGGTLSLTGPTEQAVPMTAALTALVGLDHSYASIELVGPIHRRDLGTSFNPDAVAHDGVLLLGDALGVANRFTGDGIGNAVHSAIAAAQAISTHPEDQAAVATAYAQAASGTFVGHLGSARHAARRYHLTWRMLAGSATNSSPLFAKSRRALFVSGALPTLGAEQKVHVAAGRSAITSPFLFACNEIAISAVRGRWPFIASLVALDHQPTRQDVRPALLFAAASMVDGRPPQTGWAPVATAIELAMLGTLALTATSPTIEQDEHGVDWPSASAVLAGDFLLSQAAALIARNIPDLSGPFADWMAELVDLRALRRPLPLFGALFEFPARVGAQLADADAATVAQLREFGNQCGRLFVHAEDVLALRGEPTRLDTTAQGLLDHHLSALPDILDTTTESDAMTASLTHCADRYASTREILQRLGPDAHTDILDEFAAALSAPALHER
jgi:2-polyprenyl-6-methoxyphenol hydroxylase-like FAD-dependent oxidoreductase